MKGSSNRALVSALLAASMPLNVSSAPSLTDLFTARFRVPWHYEPHLRNRGKGKRRAHNASASYRRPSHSHKAHCGHRQAARYAKQHTNINWHFDERMAFNARHAEMVAKRDEAMRRGKIRWGRR